MSKTNCINCGATKDTSEIKCPFCGTTYLDMTAIDFTSDDPVVCQFVLPYSKDKIIMSMLAHPQLDELKMQSNETEITSFGAPIYKITESKEMNVGISFKPVVNRKTNELFSVKIEV